MKASCEDELLIIFRPRLTLAWSIADPGDVVTIDSLKYQSVVDSDFTGFYNRVLDASSCLVGIEVIFLVEGIDLLAKIATLPYVGIGHATNSIRVFFHDSSPAAVRIADDQAFGGRIYESVTGVLAISIDMTWLSPFERRCIETASADWVNLV